MTGAQALIESLKREQVTHMFGHAGATICPITDCLKAAPEIDYTLVRTEQSAGHMASGYARASGKVGVCLVASGPGATNLVTGIATAYADSIPMVAITGQVQSFLLGRDIFQEVDITNSVAPFTKHSYLVKNACDIPRVVKEAFHIASTGRQGPVLIDLPIDIQKQEIDFEYPTSVNIRGYKPVCAAEDAQVEEAVEAIRSSEKPLICAGGGVFSARAREELTRFAESAGIPVVTTMMGLSLLPTEHPLNIGMIGSQGGKAANYALFAADLLIIIGARVADRAMPRASEVEKNTRIIHLDVDPAEIGKNISVETPVIGDIKTVLAQLIAKNPTVNADAWVKELKAKRGDSAIKTTATHEGFVTPRFLMQELGSQLSDDAYVFVDVGQNQIWACKELPTKNGRLLTTGGFGTMGYSLPAAIGMKKADPGRQTAVICGDGGFMMSMCELGTLKAIRADLKIILLQNNTLGLVREVQSNLYSGPFGIELEGTPDFLKLAAAYGIEAASISEDSEMPDAIHRMLRSKGPYLLLCRVSPDAMTSD